MEGTSQFYVPTSLTVVRNILRVMHRHSGDESFPQRFSLGGIPEDYSDCVRVASEASKVLMVRSWTSGKPSGPPLVHPHPISVVEPGGTSMSPASVRDRLSPTRKEKLWCKVCLHPHLEQGGTPPVEKWQWSLFSLLQMGANNSSLTPSNCILKKTGIDLIPRP